ncbi:uncharacterized protein N7515_000185 [Penicillium bovifimosum]|uniref:Uncharacterized protein n=1 Tax=Penicillium bovifimosum TaxID=126998 RepID=A0A9W9HF16_9EURO|nr:uncharacterized protein N7515_000185 [Penicillium bovifimosum]KAJ5145621.1 hypothetical protein N7515_000185 [Penicillium bovifimosum]
MASSEIPVFERLLAYSFDSDPEFANGLSIILGHPDTPATKVEINRDDDLVLQAKCFFFSRKENLVPAIDFAAFKSWLGRTEPQPSADSQITTSDKDATGSESGTHPEPAYPSSFAHIVELITTGQPIPGIQDIPDTVLSGHDIASEKPRRPKPWERGEVTMDADDTTTAAP